MAARFWRAVGFDTHDGGDLELSALTLSDLGGRIDQLALTTVSHAPASGVLEAIGDGLAGTSCIFSGNVVRSPGFAIVWDFGAGVAKELAGIGIGTGLAPGKAAERLQIHSSGDGSVWDAEYFISGIPDSAAEISFTNYNAKILASSPVAFWPLDETSGTTAVELVAGRNGTRTGGLLLSPGLVPLSPAAFDPASSGLISVPSSAAFDLSTFSLEFWLRTTSPDNLVIMERNGNTGFSVQISGAISAPNFTPKGIGVASGDALGTYTAGSNIAVATGLPLYCVVAVTPAGAHIYVNAVDVTKGSAVMIPNWGGAPFFIGSRAGAYGMPAGSLIDKVALYDRVLSPVEIQAHYSARDIVLGATLIRTPQPKVLRLAAGAPVAGVALQAHDGLICDMEHSGRGFIASTVKVKHSPTNTPLRRRVRLIHERSGLPIRETWSDLVTGDYRFEYIDEAEVYTVVSYDHLHDYCAVISDNLTLANGGVELMP